MLGSVKNYIKRKLKEKDKSKRQFCFHPLMLRVQCEYFLSILDGLIKFLYFAKIYNSTSNH